MQYEQEVYRGLKHACKNSNREGKWSTPPEVRNESDVPDTVNVHNVLIQLVKDSKAQKKHQENLFRPTGLGAGGGGFNNPLQEGERSSPKDGGKRSEPKTKDDGNNWGKPDGAEEEKKPSPGDMVEKSVGMMIGVGMMGSAGGISGAAKSAGESRIMI